MNEVITREALPDDLERITEIYGQAVLNGTGSFETVPPGPEEMTRRFNGVTEKGYPIFVAETGGVVIGYAYASPYHSRQAYCNTVETSVYIDPDYHGKGTGKKLLGRLIDACTLSGCRQMIGIVGDSRNAGSIHLHRSMGFHITGTLHSVGFKQGRWLDVVFMQRSLGDGDQTQPRSNPG